MRGATGAANSDAPGSDAELLAAHVAGDPNAFATLVHRHQDRLWAVALRMMRNPHDAADALQDAYLAAFRRADGYRGDARVTTWLHRIVVNACLDRLRTQRRRLAEQTLPDDPDRLAELASPGDRDPAGATDLRDDLTSALAELNDDQREALVLVDVEGYAVDEAAAVLGVPPGTVKSRCARGRARLARALRERRSADSAADSAADSTAGSAGGSAAGSAASAATGRGAG